MFSQFHIRTICVVLHYSINTLRTSDTQLSETNKSANRCAGSISRTSSVRQRQPLLMHDDGNGDLVGNFGGSSSGLKINVGGLREGHFAPPIPLLLMSFRIVLLCATILPFPQLFLALTCASFHLEQ